MNLGCENMSKVIILVAGFCRTGKDSFFRALKSVSESHPKPDNHTKVWTWAALANESGEEKMDVIGMKRLDSVSRVAFADILKTEVHDRLDLPAHQRDPIWLEANKDTLLFDGKTLRQHYIDTAMARREEDPLYWVRKATESLPNGYSGDEDHVVVVTDWRFPNEEEFIKDYAAKHGHQVLTMRLFRPDVPIPANDNVSERSLDAVATDILFVPWLAMTESYTKALELWPQYADHRLVGMSEMPMA